MIAVRMTALIGLLLLAGTAHADPDVKLDVPAPLIADALHEQITKVITAQPGLSLGWRPKSTQPVVLSRAGAQRVHARLDLVHDPKAAKPDPVTIEFDVLFDCGADGPTLAIEGAEVNGGTGAAAAAIDKAG